MFEFIAAYAGMRLAWICPLWFVDNLMQLVISDESAFLNVPNSFE